MKTAQRSNFLSIKEIDSLNTKKEGITEFVEFISGAVASRFISKEEGFDAETLKGLADIYTKIHCNTESAFHERNI
ncbi:hypothetical protein [Photobacterium kishitanii]|uniref:Uncharacterized protein n=1 Tax=Photobacterium kishitanii TaxID=318456 RepID=A0A2T3KMD0_9GAMM|nr:hypothetical protein [Photobacterium kishitanii]PSV00932.1 hypothetical protein C9J27_02600 [Photobacterium kishitanii]